MPASRTAALGLTLLLAGGLAACGGDDGGDGGNGGGDGGRSSETVSASAYAADVCGAMQDWMQGIQDRTAALTENLQPGEEQGKDLLVDLMSEMSAQTGELVGAVEDAGVPDVDGGEESADQLVAALQETQDALDQAKEDIEALPEDPQAFQQGAAQIGPTLQEALSNVGSSLEEASSQELTDAFEKEESCSAIP
ncbi:MAG TPA: hypothetical protein VHJ76_03495 [Actinomycetota bacterium]|nr:hypothetical protein [Actinomycetota bacterium]